MTNWKSWNFNFGAQNMKQQKGWMQSLMILLSLMVCYQSAQSQTIPTDKLLHLSAGYVISTTMTATLHHYGVKDPELWGIAAGFAAGIIKEIIDDRPDPADAYATMWGAAIGGVVISIPIYGKNGHSKRGGK